ncbi:TPR REGION domain-containing protein [Citrus sinensis]|uniref:TPR REGION domain-containing protein n=1 Tax=Citrus sinensis TaxID=2711 RepID=A0ACB8L0X2_CITSI|nr:TPR REGION domain-containing protein [Citrus sinensis]
MSSASFTTRNESNPHRTFRLKNWGFGSCVSRGNSIKRSCSANFNEFLDDEFAKQAEELARRLDIMDDHVDNHDHDQNNKETAYAVRDVNMGFSMQFMLPKYELLEHNLLGIRPEPVDWPEREEIVRVNIEQRANCVGIPLSLRMIKRKQKWKEGFGDAEDFAYCSVNKAFSSLVFIIRELQACALHIREGLYCEDLKEIIMHSMSNNVGFAASLSPGSSETITETVSLTGEKDQETSEIDSSTMKNLLLSISDIGNDGDGKKVSRISSGNADKRFSRSSPSIQYPSFIPYEMSEVSSGKQFPMNKEELDLWNSVLDEALRIQEESEYRILDHETMQHFVTPVTVKLEPDDYMDYFRTDLLYQMGVAEEPNNPLLLLNYAQFLHLVTKDYDRAEECFKRAIQSDPPDAEALSQYADFLWLVRKDLWAAEETYQQAMAAEPNSSSYASKYASFLWNTGGEETCFPLSSSQDDYNHIV